MRSLPCWIAVLVSFFVGVASQALEHAEELLATEDAEAAMGVLEALANKSEDSARYLWTLAAALTGLGRFEEAAQQAARAATLEPPDERQQLLRSALDAWEDSANKEIDNLRRHSTDNAKGSLELVSSLQGWGKYTEANNKLSELLEKHPADEKVILAALGAAMDQPDPQLDRLTALGLPLQSRWAQLHVFKQPRVSAYFALLQQPKEMLYHSGLSCSACTVNRQPRPFSPRLAEAYTKPRPIGELEAVPLDSIGGPNMRPDGWSWFQPHTVLLPFRDHIVTRLRNFVRSNIKFFPPRYASCGLRAYWFDPKASPANLMDSVLAAMHQHLPENVRASVKGAEWWAPSYPAELYPGKPQFVMAQDFHLDDKQKTSVATSVLYLSDDHSPTLIVNQSDRRTEPNPVAWMSHAVASTMVTYPSNIAHSRLPGFGARVGTRRVSLNVEWLVRRCQEESAAGGCPFTCKRRPVDGWSWDADIPPEDVLKPTAERVARLPPHARAYDPVSASGSGSVSNEL